MAEATSRPPAPMASMPMPPAVGRVAVGAQQGLARDCEPLKVHLVADAVAGPREEDTVFRGNVLEEPVVVGVLESGLQGVVVHVAHRELGLDAFDADGLELEVGHGPGGVLGQGLVDPECAFDVRFSHGV